MTSKFQSIKDKIDQYKDFTDAMKKDAELIFNDEDIKRAEDFLAEFEKYDILPLRFGFTYDDSFIFEFKRDGVRIVLEADKDDIGASMVVSDKISSHEFKTVLDFCSFYLTFFKDYVPEETPVKKTVDPIETRGVIFASCSISILLIIGLLVYFFST